VNKMIKSIIIIYVRISGISKECTSLTQSHFCVCPKPGPWFPKSYILVYFVFEWFQVRVVVLFVHTGRIVDLHCLYWQNCWPSLFILAELLTFTVYTGRIVDLYCLYWQNCWPSLFILAELLTFTVYTGRIVDLHCLNYLFINGFQVYILHIHCVIPLLLSVTFSFLSSKLFFVDLSLS
jgi:hypothetical protein